MSSFLPVSQLFNQSAIYVIPTFQRPYAWEKPQWADLLRDIDNAVQKKSSTHYFAAIHTIKIPPTDPMWLNYTDAANPDIQKLNECGFQTDTNYDVHLVVDGQQRMIALFALLECFKHVNNRYVEISDDYKIPKLILNPAADHANWRVLLGLDKGALHEDMRSQKRLQDMFLYFQGGISAFPPKHYNFLIGGNCTLQPIILPTGSSLAPFLTLNDRGRGLTYLEKMKSLVMEADENGGSGLATQINTSFGAAYRSIDQKGSQLDENGFLRQLGIWLWEGKSVTDEPVHNMALDKLYAVYREQLSQSATNVMPLVQNIVDNINQLSKHHNELVVSYKNALNNIKTGQPSFVGKMFSTASGRDSCDDYQMVIESLGLQAKQLAVLFAICERFPGIDLHQPLGIINGSNQNIKNQLLILAKSLDEPWKSMIEAEVYEIPEGQREITPLHLAELLRLIVGDSKPGTFATTWQNTFGNPGLTKQQFLDGWMNYLLSFNSRDNFILWSIAGNLCMDNNSVLLKYLLREFEYCLPGGINAHRTTGLEIEHYFARDYSAISALPGHGFLSQADYENSFLDMPGNKLLLDSSLNGAIKKVSVDQKTSPYATGSYGTISVPITEHTQSAQQMANDLGTRTNLGELRAYVASRQLRLAVFAARRF